MEIKRIKTREYPNNGLVKTLDSNNNEVFKDILSFNYEITLADGTKAVYNVEDLAKLLIISEKRIDTLEKTLATYSQANNLLADTIEKLSEQFEQLKLYVDEELKFREVNNG